MKYKKFGSTGVSVAAIGQGSMGVGGQFSPDVSWDEEQVAALKLGIAHGMTLIDTAEIYGGGHAEEVIGKAIEGVRDRVFVATKFSPEHSSYRDVLAAAEGSLARLKTDYIDLYQIHWPNPEVDIRETMRALEELVDAGKVRHIGVSNFSLSQLKEVRTVLKKHGIVSNQVEYNLFDRSIEKDLLPYCEKENIALIAYSPLDQGKATSGSNVLETLAKKYGKTASQVTLNWLSVHPAVFPIPKALKPEHIAQNAGAVDFLLAPEDIEAMNIAFKREPLLVPVTAVEVSVQGEGARKVYQTREEALANRLGFTPSPSALANYIAKHPDEDIKPVRLMRRVANGGKSDYDLVEGRVRYWAWVIAFDGKRPIPAYVRE